MSQPKQYREGELDPWARPIRHRDDLVQFFIDSARSRSDFWVGVEHERFAVVKNTTQPVRYSGAVGIEALLKAFVLQPGALWEPVFENGHVIALTGEASITLEPGGQVELSGAPQKSISDVDSELTDYENRMKRAADSLGIEFLSVGYHKAATREDFEWVPKERYGIMRRYMPKVGGRGIDMMLRTCTVQANLDYENEADMVASFRTGLAISPIVTALFTTSMPNERTFVWRDTDPARCGFPPVVFEQDFGFERWVEFALDVPMYFIRRDGHYIDMAGASFRDLMKGGKALIRDFIDHLSTIFTEVRVKPQIELRSADCGSAAHLRALPAFWMGLLYNTSSRQKAFELMDNPSVQELSQLQLDAALFGLKANYRGRNLGVIAEQVLQLASDGLKEDERRFLAPLLIS